MSRIAAVVVSYGTAALAVKAVESLLDRSGGAGIEIHLVDGGPGGPDAAFLRA